MKTSDLKYVKEWYSEYRSLLFNNDIPDVEDVDFKLHSLTYAAGYSAYIEHPKTKSGNNHVIAFCKLFVFSEKEIKEILDCSPSTARAVMTKLRDMKVVKVVNVKERESIFS